MGAVISWVSRKEDRCSLPERMFHLLCMDTPKYWKKKYSDWGSKTNLNVFTTDETEFPRDPTKCRHFGPVGRSHLLNSFHTLLGFCWWVSLCFRSVKAHGFSLSLFFFSKHKERNNIKHKGNVMRTWWMKQYCMFAWLLKITYKRIKANVERPGLLSELGSIDKKLCMIKFTSLQAIKNLFIQIFSWVLN